MVAFQDEIKPSYLAEIERTFAKFMYELLPNAVRDELAKAGKNKDVRLLIDILTLHKNLSCKSKDEKPFIKLIISLMKKDGVPDPEIAQKVEQNKRKLCRIRKELNKPAHNHDKKDDPEFQKKITLQIRSVIISIAAPEVSENYIERLCKICDSIGVENYGRTKLLDMREKLDTINKDFLKLKKKYTPHPVASHTG